MVIYPNTKHATNREVSLPVIGIQENVATVHVPSYDEIDAQLKEYEIEQRRCLGLIEKPLRHWTDANPQDFTDDQRQHTTILLGGLTLAQDKLIAAALSGQGYTMLALDVPDNEALRRGKEFGNRGQCNPTYFTVGSLIKYLIELRDQKGLSKQEIVDRYLFLTAGSCGPCRFGTYATEYRKALRDAGFEGFRVILFQQQGGLKQATGKAAGLRLDPPFFIAMLKAIMVGDLLNAMGYRLRPYEVNTGDTDQAIDACVQILQRTMRRRRSVLVACLRCRRILAKVKVDRSQVKPKVSIIGEFWAMTTEGDGNYRLQRFLESEGAEVDIQLVTAWLLYNIWQVRHDTKRRMMMPYQDVGRQGLKDKNPRKRLMLMWAAEKTLRTAFHLFARVIGLTHYHLPDMDEIATISHQYYDIHLRGGEGHMEVGKLIQTVTKKKAHMVVSVKPFGCMPSSGVSDGIQSAVTSKYPQAIFCAIETTGDGAVNIQSRVQMDLFKAKQAAEREFELVREQLGISSSTAQQRIRNRRRGRSLYYPANRFKIAGTSAGLLAKTHCRSPGSDSGVSSTFKALTAWFTTMKRDQR